MRQKYRWIGLVLLILLLAAVRIAVDKRVGQEEPISSSDKSSETVLETQTITINNEDRLVKRMTTLVDKVGGRVSWSHKNDLIAFGKRGEDSYSDLYIMNPDGSNQVCLTCGKPDIPQLSNDQPEWHPDGEYIIFQTQDPNLTVPFFLKFQEKRLTQGGAGVNNNLWAVSQDGQKFYQLTHIQSMEAILHPHFSHDGKKLFWAARVLEEGKRGHWVFKVADFVIDTQGSRLVNEKVYEPFGEGQKSFYESHGFTQDDKKIIFSASKKDLVYDLDIYLMDLASGELTNLTNSPGVWDEHAILSPSGKKLVWMSSRGYAFTPTANWGATLKTDYWLMNVDGSEKTQLTFFNKPGYPEYASEKVVVADSDWNKTGDEMVAVMMVGNLGSRIVLIELRKTQ